LAIDRLGPVINADPEALYIRDIADPQLENRFYIVRDHIEEA
jgi:hypothetical protein